MGGPCSVPSRRLRVDNYTGTSDMSADELHARRKGLGLTQQQLAEALGYAGGKTTIWLKESGSRPVTTRDLLAIEALEKRANEAQEG